MAEQRYRWKSEQLREQLAIIDGKRSPTKLLTNATYLHAYLRQWKTGNIWIYQDRIVYVGERLPSNLEQCEVIDCSGYYLVPGYIEPHAHPFQLYNPQTFAEYAAKWGTTTIINDNLVLALQSPKKKAFSFLRDVEAFPVTMYWWCRFDGQTELEKEEERFSYATIKEWLKQKSVVQGGELTGWPRLLAGDDVMLHWIQEAKQMKKQIEGHFPGASEKTLTKMMLIGADCDHEAMTGKEVYNRLLHGYTVSLRYSSICPDLPVLLEEMKALGIEQYDRLIFTTDGSPPSFYEQGLIDQMIRIAMEKGVPIIDAYQMATVNVARHYQMEHLHGSITTGRIAHINFLRAPDDPTPVSVLAKGQWVKRDGVCEQRFPALDWEAYGMAPLRLTWQLSPDDLQFSMPLGMYMENSVIMRPYSISIDTSHDELSTNHDESFLMLIDRNGKWRVNTVVKGFATHVKGLASSYSNTGDLLLVGKSKHDMLLAFQRMNEIGGGIVLAENRKIIHEIPLPLGGMMSMKHVEALIAEEKRLKELLKERGYSFVDPIYSLLFFQSTHLPYIRITQKGIYDVMNKTILFPSIMR
ncbi:adenine deaminase C-terminal domain-containing protein [Anoxybacillus sp. J5B_2022]|uniref:adenine deaminase C-terminal domain-containing protein n=1 Tax=Anoxybacillus sp. J5B_2022 TaxID=3003246 RepID=UPI0022859407|nr:adenine deaminase C-terminal domain-containing protein [Anoxybacillus sp. J5B_2022]MCZ0755941.1 amidohydrolase family protein [Anoxybacillus sp. J5B_2022]